MEINGDIDIWILMELLTYRDGLGILTYGD